MKPSRPRWNTRIHNLYDGSTAGGRVHQQLRLQNCDADCRDQHQRYARRRCVLPYYTVVQFAWQSMEDTTQAGRRSERIGGAGELGRGRMQGFGVCA